MAMLFDRSDTIDLDVERSGPHRNVDEGTRGWIVRKIPGIHRVHLREHLNTCAVDVALQDVLQRRAGGLKTELHLVQNDLGLALDRSFDNFTRLRIEGRKAGDVDSVAISCHCGGRSLPSLKVGG